MAPTFPRSSPKKGSARLRQALLGAALPLFLLGAPSPLAAAPLCPGPVSRVPLLPPPGSPGETPDRLLELARILRDHPGGQPTGLAALSRAETLLRALPEAARKSPGVRVLRAERDTELVLYRGFPGGMRFGKRAERNVDRALRRDPSNARAHLLKGIALYYKPWFVGGSVTKALAEFERADRLSPNDPRTLSWIGVARHRLGRSGARRAMAKVRALCPQSPFYRLRATSFDPRIPHP